ncbi:MAG: arginine repressor, partial [Clostridiales bacterium]|nr:arginine repressor [Clostridiales bacterium]
MKKKRLAKVLELINQYEIETQEELQQKLRETGFEVTQATISRDIKELRLVKELSAQGRYKYTASRKVEDMSGRVGSILLDCVV